MQPTPPPAEGPLRVGLDLSCWLNPRGYGRYTRELLRALVPAAPDIDFVGFTDPWTRERLDLEAAHLRVVRVAQSEAPSRAAAAAGHRSPLDMLALTRAVAREPLDVFFSPSVYTYFPLPLRLPAVVVVHDTIAERFPRLTLPSRRARLFWRAKVRLALWQARRVLTVSDFSARELTEVLGVAPERIRVTLEAPAPAYRPGSTTEEIARVAESVGLPLGARWLTYVGGFNPHKQVPTLVRAHAALRDRLGDAAPHLVLVGAVEGDVFHQAIEEIRQAIEAAGTADRVHWAGYLADAELRHLHAGAAALVLPSSCEGFGLPAVEAAACGTPVVATTQSPLPGLLEGGGLFVPPGDEALLADALATLLGDEQQRRQMGQRAAEQAAALDWESSAAVVLGALREAASSGRGGA